MDTFYGAETMNLATFKIWPIKHPHDGPQLEFEILGLTTEQEKLVANTFNTMFGERFVFHGENFLQLGTKLFNSNFKGGDEARMFFGALQELGLDFDSPAKIRENMNEAIKKLSNMHGTQK